MNIYGMNQDGKKMKFRQAIILCKVEELDKLISFFETIERAISENEYEKIKKLDYKSVNTTSEANIHVKIIDTVNQYQNGLNLNLIARTYYDIFWLDKPMNDYWMKLSNFKLTKRRPWLRTNKYIRIPTFDCLHVYSAFAKIENLEPAIHLQDIMHYLDDCSSDPELPGGESYTTKWLIFLYYYIVGEMENWCDKNQIENFFVDREFISAFYY